MILVGKKENILIESAILFALGISSVFPTLFGSFVFDDSEAIVKNEDVISPEKINLSQVFFHDFWGVRLAHPQSHKSYRPLTTLSFRLDYYLWNSNALPFHLINLITHGFNCCLSYLFLIKCLSKKTLKKNTANTSFISQNGSSSYNNGLKFNVKISTRISAKNRKICFWASLLFAVHPIHVEPLGGLVGRADLFSAFIFLLSYILVSNDTNLRSAIQISICGIFGSLFKENSIVIVIFYIGNQILKKQKLGMKQISYHIFSLVITGSFILWRLWFQNGPPVFQPYDNPAAFSESYFTKVFSIIYVWMLNVFLLSCPIWLCYDWSMDCIALINSIWDQRVFLILAFIGFLVVVLITSFRNRTIIISLLISAATFLPSSNLLFTVGFVIAERNLYLVSLGFCLFISHIFNSKDRCDIFTFILVVFFARSLQRSFQWTSQEKLFQAGLEVCPNNAKIHYNLGTIYMDAANVEMAASSYKKAIQLKPDYYQSMNNLGNLFRTIRNIEEAELWLRKAVRIKYDFPPAWMNLGIVLSQKNKTEALHCYRKALEYRKHYPDCEYNLGNLYLEIGDTEMAYKSWQRTITLKPTHSQAWINILVLLDQKEKLIEAKEWGINASKVLKNDDTVQFLLGNILGKLDEYDQARKHFENAIQLCNEYKKPIPAKYWSNLGVLYHRWGKKQDAVKCYEKALKLDPSSESTVKNLAMLKLSLSKI